MKKKICRWCGKEIFRDAMARTWYWIRPDGALSYYCTKDENPDRCEHIPE